MTDPRRYDPDAVTRLISGVKRRGGFVPPSPLGDDLRARQRARRCASALADDVPPLFRDAVADDPTVADWCDHVAAGGRDNLLLVGPVGTGKSWQLYGAMKRLLTARTWVKVWPMLELLPELRPSGEHPAATMRSTLAAPVLLLDDLGVETSSDWVSETVQRLVESRLLAGLPTAVTSNLSLAQLGERYGQRVLSRFLAAGSERIAVLRGHDRRMAAGGWPTAPDTGRAGPLRAV